MTRLLKNSSESFVIEAHDDDGQFENHFKLSPMKFADNIELLMRFLINYCVLQIHLVGLYLEIFDILHCTVNVAVRVNSILIIHDNEFVLYFRSNANGSADSFSVSALRKFFHNYRSIRVVE